MVYPFRNQAPAGSFFQQGVSPDEQSALDQENELRKREAFLRLSKPFMAALETPNFAINEIFEALARAEYAGSGDNLLEATLNFDEGQKAIEGIQEVRGKYPQMDTPTIDEGMQWAMEQLPQGVQTFITEFLGDPRMQVLAGYAPAATAGVAGVNRSIVGGIADAAKRYEAPNITSTPNMQIGGNQAGIINLLTGEDFDVKLATPVSTAIPSVAQQYKQGIDAHTRGDLLVNSADLSADKKEALADIYRDYPALRNIDPLDADAALDEASDFMANNLDFVMDIMPDKWMEKSQDWYNGFNRIAQSAAKDHNVSQEQSTGIIAALSPQTDWNVNLSRADRIMDTWNTRQEFPWSQAMDEVMPKLRKSISEKKYKDKLQNIVGKRLIDLEDPSEKAMWIRAYDEAHNPREFHLYNPDGTQGRIATKQDGTAREANWASTLPIEKSVRMLMDGSQRNISEQVGEGHKVRSFFRNAADPTEPTTTTMDTHAVAAALLRPLSAKAEEVGQNFGSVVKDAATGMKGTYPINQDAYNRVARRHGVEGRAIQSPTWEFVREMMEGQKGQIAGQPKGVVMDDYVKRLWEAYEDGRMSQRQVQEEIVKAFGIPSAPY